MNRILKSLRRFWRGLTRRMRAVLVLSLVLLTVLASFGVYSALAPEDGGGADTANQTLFAPVSRDRIESVVLHFKGGAEYTVLRYAITDEKGKETGTYGLKLMQGEKDYGYLTLDAEQLSSLVVGTGMNYVYDEVISRPEEGSENYAEALSIYEQKLTEYRLGDDAPYYILTTTAGESYRVYYGSKTATGTSYYVRLEGEDKIFVTAGADVGTLLYSGGPEALIAPTIFVPSDNDAAYNFAGHFGITSYVRYTDAGMRVNAATDRVGFTVLANGERTALRCDLTHADYADFAAVFADKTVGTCDFTFSATLPTGEKNEDGTDKTESISYHVVSVDYIDRGKELFAASYIDASKRDIKNKYSIYKFTREEHASYIPDSTEMMNALKSIMSLTGSVVRVGLEGADVMTEYGLYRHVIEIDYPWFGDEMYKYELDSQGNKVMTDDLDVDGYLEGVIYVSDETENGTRYVASLMYGIVVEVDASSLSFLENDFIDWTEPYMVNAHIDNITKLYMKWSYGAEKWMQSAYTLEVKHDLKTESGTDGQNAYSVIQSVTAKPTASTGGGDIAIDTDIYTQFFFRLEYIKYKGGHSLTEEELTALLSDPSKRVLELRIYLSGNATAENPSTDSIQTYHFIPISSDRVLVAVKDSRTGVVNDSFVIYGMAFKDLARAYTYLMEGVPFDHEVRY